MKLLEGVRVLDLSWLIPGPYTTMLLADLGADVIKLEAPGSGDYFRAGSDPGVRGGNSLYFLWLNRNKRSVAVDFRTEEGWQVPRPRQDRAGVRGGGTAGLVRQARARLRGPAGAQP